MTINADNPGDVPLLVSDRHEHAGALRARFQQWGYLYFPRVVGTDQCRDLLRTFIGELDPYLRADADGNPVLAGAPFVETDPIWDRVYPRLQAVEAFHALFHSPRVVELMRLVSGDEVFVYPMKMARIATPGKIGHETPPHQDAYSHHAGPTMAGIWIALHDVGAGMGRLKLLPGSHTAGVRRVFEAPGVGGVQCEVREDETSWHVSDVECGDVIIFHSCMVHAAEPNTARTAARISVDTRFCNYGAPVFTTNVEPHHGWRIEQLTWDFIYRNWHSDALKYYWRDYPGLFSEYGRYGWQA